MDFEKKDYPIVKVDGFIEKGKQFDIEVNMPEDNRNVIFGVIKDCFKEPVENAVVKLIEVCREYGKEERKPVSHTFTDKDGEFVFGPLCPDKDYELQFWADKVKHYKICADCKRQGKCLKGVKLDCKDKEDYDYKKDYKDDYKKDQKDDCDDDYKDDYKKDYKDGYKDECKEDCKKDEKDNHKDKYKEQKNDTKSNHYCY